MVADWFESMYEDVADIGVRFTAEGVVTLDPVLHVGKAITQWTRISRP